MDTMVWKVVRVFSGGWRYSVNGERRLTYERDVWVEPPRGRLFAFKDVTSARRFLKLFQEGQPLASLELWEAQAEDVRPQPTMLLGIYLADERLVQRFWSGDLRPDDTTSTPPGTVSCSRLRLLQVVNPQEPEGRVLVFRA